MASSYKIRFGLTAASGSMTLKTRWLHLGERWHRFRVAAGGGSGERWSRCFGQMVELWVRLCAQRAAPGLPADTKLVTSDRIGDATELEDAVFVRCDAAALVSVKSSVMRGVDVREARNPADLITWYERVLFGETSPARKQKGALHLLDDRVQKIRAGGTAIDRGARIYPLIVSFDSWAEGPALYKWVNDRCKQLGILQQQGVALPAIVSCGTFEAAMGLVRERADLFELLDQRSRADSGLVWDPETLAGRDPETLAG